jgi:hypothetical protein
MAVSFRSLRFSTSRLAKPARYGHDQGTLKELAQRYDLFLKTRIQQVALSFRCRQK